MEFDLENPLTFVQEHQSDTIPDLFASESDYMPCEDYIRSFKPNGYLVFVRQEAISLILHAQFSCKFDPVISYLAVNYLDRFISNHGLPERKKWMVKLVSISCLSLAAKMKKVELPLNIFQGEEQLIFDSQTIQRMELLILGALKWQLRSITPFSFLYFFLSLFKLNDPPLIDALKARASELFFKSQNEIKVLEFKPSILSASALLIACHELSPSHFLCFRDAVSSCAYINNEKVVRCCNVMEDAIMDGYKSVFDMATSSNTAVNVLDRNWSSSESTTTAAGGSLKRRKINDFSFSEIQDF